MAVKRTRAGGASVFQALRPHRPKLYRGGVRPEESPIVAGEIRRAKGLNAGRLWPAKVLDHVKRFGETYDSAFYRLWFGTPTQRRGVRNAVARGDFAALIKKGLIGDPRTTPSRSEEGQR